MQCGILVAVAHACVGQEEESGGAPPRRVYV